MISFRHSIYNEPSTHRSSRQRSANSSKKQSSKEVNHKCRTSRSRSPIKDRETMKIASSRMASLESYDNKPFDKASELKRLEQEMINRKLRIAKWRIECQLDLNSDNNAKSLITQSTTEEKDRFRENEDVQQIAMPSIDIKQAETDEDDPLDQYMDIIKAELSHSNNNNETVISATQSDHLGNISITNEKGIIVRIISKEVNNTAVTITDSQSALISRSKTHRMKQKGTIMEEDIDGLEYSSDDESKQTNDSLNNICVTNGKRSKADIIIANHRQIVYQPFHKDFYTVMPEIAEMTVHEVAAYRKELDNTKVTGKNCPRPIRTWSQCIKSAKILQRLKKYNYEKPTPIQAQALPIIISGRDMIGIAKTGSGKTLAFLLPMFCHIQDQPPLKYTDGPIAIIMTPTRELALQTTKECRKFAKLFNIRCTAIYGGIGVANQISELKRGTEIIVCTPGRMIDMLAMNNGKITNLRRVTYVVLDEADRMFDMGFEPQVNTMLDSIRPDRQLIMFSATFPRKMEALARQHLSTPIEVIVGGRSIVCKEVRQNVLLLDDDDQKYLKLLELLGLYQSHGSVLVFVERQMHCDELMKKLIKDSYPCMPLHGGIDQYDRDSTIVDFKNGDIPLIIATSVAARGLDVKNLILVINYDCPNHYEEYVHRCGRTGRAGNVGVAYTFITPAQGSYAGAIIKALEASGTPVPDELTLLWDNYVKKMDAEGKKVQAIHGGLNGRHGYKFDSSEKRFNDIQKKMQNILIGLEDADEVSEDIDQNIESLYNSKKSVRMEDESPAAQNDTLLRLETAKKVAARLSSIKSESLSCLRGATTSSSPRDVRSSVAMAQQRAQEINIKLNYQKPPDKIELNENTSKIFEEELEINDFPPNVRSKIISKATLEHICDYADVDIFVRGQYYPNNKKVLPGDKKIHLQIQSLNEYGLQLAKVEITRLIRDEMIKMQNSSRRLANHGRYNIMT